MKSYYYVLHLITFTVFCACFCLCNHVEFGNLVHGSEIGFKKEVYEPKTKDTHNGCKDYVNPHDMRNYVHGSKSKLAADHRSCQGTDVNAGCENCSAYMQRFINLFLRATGLKDYVLKNKNSKRVTLDLIVNQDNLEIIQLFAETGNADLNVVNKALTDILTVSGTTFENKYFEEEASENTKLHFEDLFAVVKPFFIFFGRLPIDYPQHCIAICVTSVFGITLWQIITTKSYKLTIFTLLFIIFGSGFGWNWFRLYKIAGAKRFSAKMIHEGRIPIYCRPDSMTWYQYVYYYFSYEKECEEFLKREMIEPIVEVNPTIVLSETLSMFILHPADKLGIAIGSFVKGLLDAIPWPYKGFVVPIIIFLVAMFIIIITVVFIGGKISFRTLLATFEIGSSTPHYNQRQERQFIENIPQSSLTPSIKDNAYNRNSNNITEETAAVLKNEFDLIDFSSDDEEKLIKIKSGSPQVHLHVHYVPQCSGDDCSYSKKDKSSDFMIKDKEISESMIKVGRKAELENIEKCSEIVNKEKVSDKSENSSDCKNKDL